MNLTSIYRSMTEKPSSTDAQQPVIPSSDRVAFHPAFNRRVQDKTYAHLGWILVTVGFFGFILWASLAPLDRGVVVDGSVTVAGYRKTIQHPTGGVVKHIHVQDGEKIQAGQTLITLDQTVIQAQAVTAESQYYMAKAIEVRLMAEQAFSIQETSTLFNSAPVIHFPDLLDEQEKNNPIIAHYAESAKHLQQNLYESRLQVFTTELRVLKAQLASAQSRLKGLKGIQQSQTSRNKLIHERITSMALLAEQDFIPRNRLLEMQESQAMLMGEMQQTESDVLATQGSINEIQSNIQLHKANYIKDIRGQLTDIRQELKAHYQHMIETRTAYLQSEITAPVSGTVVSLNAHTLGGVVRPADKLMEIVPEDQTLLVEAKLPLESIDSLSLNQQVDLMFTAFNRSQTPKVSGEVVYISADKLIDETTQTPYYGAHIKVGQSSLAELNGLQILPGMPVQAFIQNGERTLISYLFKPFVDRIPMALAGDE